MDKKVYRKANPILYFACLLCCLVVITTSMTGNIYAKFVASESAADSARVAKFDVSVSNTYGETPSEIKLATGATTASYSFTVTSNSEVAVKYDVVVSWTGEWPTNVTLALDDGSAVQPTGTSHTFVDAGSFTVSDAGATNTKEHNLTLAATVFGEPVNLTGIQVDVVASQID